MDSSPMAAAPQVLLLPAPSSPDPSRCSSRSVAPWVPVAMPSPPAPAPPAAAAAPSEEEYEKRRFPISLPLPLMKLKQLFPRAVSWVFAGMGRPWGMAMIGFHAFICVIKVASYTTDPEVARFWLPIFRAWLYLGLAFMLLMACVDIGNYLAGVCAAKSDLPPQQKPGASASALLLPPAPPEMDMC